MSLKLKPSPSNDRHGLHGPFRLSADAPATRRALIQEGTACDNKMNLHASSSSALRLIHDTAIVEKVVEIFGTGYKLWRTNFFQRHQGTPHAGVAWHHDKHFQDGDAQINYHETGDHISILIALDDMDADSGLFHYIPGSHIGELPDYQRDPRPYASRPPQDHFPTLPESVLSQAAQMEIPRLHFCLFHSALLHHTAPSDGKKDRISMIGRLARLHCNIPEVYASTENILPYC